MLKKAADDRTNANILRQAFNSRPQGADAANDQFDLNTSLRRTIKLIDHVAVGNAVGLDDDPALFCLLAFHFPPNERDQPVAQIERSHDQAFVFLLLRVAG